MVYKYCLLNDLIVNMNKTKQLVYGRRKYENEDLPEVNLESYSTFLEYTVN